MRWRFPPIAFAEHSDCVPPQRAFDSRQRYRVTSRSLGTCPLVANSLCRGHEKRTMRETEVQIGNSDSGFAKSNEGDLPWHR